MATASDTVKTFPYRGTPQTVAKMFEVSNGERGAKSWRLRERVEDVIKAVRPRDYWSECLAVYYWVCSPQFRYTRDPQRVELVKSPLQMLWEIDTRGVTLGDCDDLSTFIRSALGTIGADVRFATVGFMSPNGELPHPNVLSDPIFRLMSSAHPRLPGPFTHVFAQGRKPTGGWVTLDPVAGPRIAEMHRRVRQVRIYHES